MGRLYDLRFVIGIFFTIAGLLLAGYYLVENNSAVVGGKLNLWSGVFYIVFGVVMIALSYTGKNTPDEL